MQDMDSFFETAIRRGYELKGSPRAIAEWNYNNIFNTTVTTIPDDQNWIMNKSLYPLTSIGSGFRPNSGIFYAVTNESSTDGSSGIGANRYYALDAISSYKYWVCPTPSAKSPRNAIGATLPTTDPTDYAVDRGVVELDYGQFVNSNKLSITFNLGPTPTDWTVSVFEEVSNAWIDIVNPDVDPLTGKCEIWWNGTSWIQTQQLDESLFQSISKVKINIAAVDMSSRRIQLIEISARREIELTNRLGQYTMTMTLDNHDYIHPIGRMSADDGAITFDNSDLKINHDDTTSDFYGALEGWCQYRTYVQYDLAAYGGSLYNVRTGTMYANDWQQENEFTYTIELFDILKVLQSIDCPALLLENQSLANIISNLLDMIGIDTYDFEATDFDSTNIVKYFWTDGTEKVFDALDGLCNSHQAALFVDEFGIIKLMSRNDITPKVGETVVWEFSGVDHAPNLADILTLKKEYETVTNKVKINYKKRQAKVDAQDITQQVLTSSVYEASDTIVLRSAPLVHSVNTTPSIPSDNYDHIFIDPSQVETWPYTGKVNIDGESIEYTGKGYYWWDLTGTPTLHENIVTSDDERKAFDQQTYTSFSQGGTTGGVSSDPSQQNRYSGRLWVTNRDLEQTGLKPHGIGQMYGWYTMDFWNNAAMSPSYPTKYFTSGGGVYNLTNIKDWVNRPGWLDCQRRASVANSVLTIDNMINNNIHTKSTMTTIDVQSSEYREFGTRLRHRSGGVSKAGIMFYASNAVGYDNVNDPLNEVFNANRCYLINIFTTAYVESINRVDCNEISVQVKNGDSLTFLHSNHPTDLPAPPGQIQIVPDTWYDIDVVFQEAVYGYGPDGVPSGPLGRSTIQVWVDGTFVGTWDTDDNIRPTPCFGLCSKDSSIIDFEDFYAAETSSKSRIRYTDDDKFNAYNMQLPSGTNKVAELELPLEGGGASDASWLGMSVISLATSMADATISSIKLIGIAQPTVELLGSTGMVLKKDQRWAFQVNDAILSASEVKITYTSTNTISLTVESSLIRSYPYGVETEPTIPANGYYDIVKGGYFSTKKDDMIFLKNGFSTNYLDNTNLSPSTIDMFYEDFGSIVHEVRDFDVELSNSPAKGVGVYSSNDNVKLVDFKYSPTRGYFTLANASHDDEIVNGTKQIDDSNSIDYSLMLYGYILEDDGDSTETVQDDLSIRRRGIISQDLDANWIFSKDEAVALGQWIVQHWSGAMDAIQLTTFCSTFIQIGDKVSVDYPNASIDPTWIFIVTGKEAVFDDGGLQTTITIRRVQ